MNSILIQDWLESEEIPPTTGQPDPANGSSIEDPYMNDNPTSGANQSADTTNLNKSNLTNKVDTSEDPPTPHMPEEPKGVADFETWKNLYLRESVKGDSSKLIDLIQQVRDKEGLNPYQRKFVEDNWNIQLLRQNANVDKASKDIRRNIKDQLDRNNPGATVVNHVVGVLDTIPSLNDIFIKLSGYGSLKGDLHRKYIGALIGGVQVGTGSNTEDIIYNERDYSILISTRFGSEFGEILIGSWALKEDDPERFLSDSERKRLDDGSPEEKEVLRKRIILESIAYQYKTRSFIINVVEDDGTIFTVGIDLNSCLNAAYTDGKLIVSVRVNDASEGMINTEGKIEAYLDVDIFYAKETGQQNEDGSPEVEHIPFIQRRNGQLYLVANLKTIHEGSSSMQGVVLKKTPYNGNPSDLKVIRRCIYTAHDMLMKVC